MKAISLMFILMLCISCSTTPKKCIEVDKTKCKKVKFSQIVDPFQRFEYDRYDRR